MVVSALLSRLSKFAIQSCHEFEVKKVKEKERARRKEVNQVIRQRLCCIYTSICFDRPNAFFMLYRFRVMFRTAMCFCDHLQTSGIYINYFLCLSYRVNLQAEAKVAEVRAAAANRPLETETKPSDRW